MVDLEQLIEAATRRTLLNQALLSMRQGNYNSLFPHYNQSRSESILERDRQFWQQI